MKVTDTLFTGQTSKEGILRCRKHGRILFIVVREVGMIRRKNHKMN